MIDMAKRTGTLAELMGLHRGIRCPVCGAAAEWSVYYTRQIPGGIRRVRICRARDASGLTCGHQVVTVEQASGTPKPK